MTSTTDETAFATENIFGKGEPNTAYAQYFTGQSFLRNLVTDPECAVGVDNVSTTPPAAAARSSSARPAPAGTRRRARTPSR